MKKYLILVLLISLISACNISDSSNSNIDNGIEVPSDIVNTKEDTLKDIQGEKVKTCMLEKFTKLCNSLPGARAAGNTFGFTDFRYMAGSVDTWKGTGEFQAEYSERYIVTCSDGKDHSYETFEDPNEFMEFITSKSAIGELCSPNYQPTELEEMFRNACRKTPLTKYYISYVKHPNNVYSITCDEDGFSISHIGGKTLLIKNGKIFDSNSGYEYP